MEDFSQLCHALRTEYNARKNPISLGGYARISLESLADLISEDRPEQFHSAMARFFASLYGGNELLNRLPVQSRESLSSMTIGFPPRRLFELLNDFGRVINELSLQEMSSKTLRLAFEENGFAYRPNEFFSMLEQIERVEPRLWEAGGPETIGINGIAAGDRPNGTFAKPTDKVPDSYKEQGRECGPLEGTKTMLAKVVTQNRKAKPDDLEKHHGGKVFVRQIQPRKLEVFFRSFKEFNAAKDQLTPDNSE